MRAQVFAENPDLLMQMLLLRLQGWSKYELARKFDTDKTTIRHWCDRTFKIAPVTQGQTPMRQVTVITFTPVETKKQYKYQHLFDEEATAVRETKTYAQIRVQARKRALIKLGVLVA